MSAAIRNAYRGCISQEVGLGALLSRASVNVIVTADIEQYYFVFCKNESNNYTIFVRQADRMTTEEFAAQSMKF